MLVVGVDFYCDVLVWEISWIELLYQKVIKICFGTDLAFPSPGWSSKISEIWIPLWSIPPAYKNILFSWQMSPKFVPPESRGEHTMFMEKSPMWIFWPGPSYLLKWWILINFNGIRWFYLLKYKNLKVLWNQAYFGSFLQKRNFLKITQFFLQKWS